MNKGGHKTGARLSAAMKYAPLYCTKNLRLGILYKSSVGDKKKEILKCGPVDANWPPFLMEEASSDSSNPVQHFMTLIRTVN